MLWSVFVFFRAIIMVCFKKAVMFCQPELRLDLKLGSKVPSKENILKEKEDRRIHCIEETLIKVGSEYILALDL